MKTLKITRYNPIKDIKLFDSKNTFEITFTMDGWNELSYIMRLDASNEDEVIEKLDKIIPNTRRNIMKISTC
jgi:hypothetical protein